MATKTGGNGEKKHRKLWNSPMKSKEFHGFVWDSPIKSEEIPIDLDLFITSLPSKKRIDIL